MAKIIAVNRKYLNLTLSILFVCFLGIAGVTVWKTAQVNSDANLLPEVKMLGVAVEPGSFKKDVTYGSTTLKSSQVIPAKTFDLLVTLQNTTDQPMMNIPVELEVVQVSDDSKKVSKMGNLPSLEPGATARVAFRQIKALGDAAGKDPTAGQHKITLRVKENSAGGVKQASEAVFFFNVDSTLKAPVLAPTKNAKILQ